MANVNQYPRLFKIDAGTISSKTLVYNGYGEIKHVIWNGATTGGHKASLVDEDDNPIWEATFQVATEGSDWCRDLNFNVPFDGLYCDDLDSGELLIYFEHLRKYE